MLPARPPPTYQRRQPEGSVLYRTLEAHLIIQFAAKNRLPAMYFSRELVEAGGLISYGVDLRDNFRRAAIFVDKILKGAKPGLRRDRGRRDGRVGGGARFLPSRRPAPKRR